MFVPKIFKKALYKAIQLCYNGSVVVLFSARKKPRTKSEAFSLIFEH